MLAIGNGFDVSRFAPAKVRAGDAERAAMGIPADAFVVCMIGRQGHGKKVAECLAAAAELAPRFPQTWFLLVAARLASDHAGGVEKAFAAANEVLVERRVAPSLRAEISQLPATMNVFCLTSWHEGRLRTIRRDGDGQAGGGHRHSRRPGRRS